ncbi:hypothetical protein [Leekyejoonella antrihumi]|uniref:Uncharacterized protein n=1 Tax=Leekyejoonella antrihumi TaxID=1660198 RepID=A0A563E3Q8_9MICO|nr:hypothetical protein [Leekyejoonella antrihumi]TWP37160.1 hypothetical protein FGL98_07020 [Leekyejoonella antrihumi]
MKSAYALLENLGVAAERLNRAARSFGSPDPGVWVTMTGLTHAWRADDVRSTRRAPSMPRFRRGGVAYRAYGQPASSGSSKGTSWDNEFQQVACTFQPGSRTTAMAGRTCTSPGFDAGSRYALARLNPQKGMSRARPAQPAEGHVPRPPGSTRGTEDHAQTA